VQQYKKQIKTGDCAYIWISGPNAGIVATGIITCAPEMRESDPQDPYDPEVIIQKWSHI